MTAPTAEALTEQLTRQLTERAATDPLAGLLLTQLQEKSAPDPLDLLERQLATVIRANTRLQEALTAANAMSGWVAHTVGACRACWGLVADCRECGGQGRPGYLPPDVEELVAWLGPALRRAGLPLDPTDPDE